MPLREPFRISSGMCSERRILLLQLVDVDGVSVWSECVAGEQPNYSPETIDTAWHAITHWFGPRVLGISFEAPHAVHEALSRNVRGHPMARATIEMGCWAVAAVQTGVALSHLIGGSRAHVATGISIGIQPSLDALVERARAARTAGYRRIKIKIEPGCDLEPLQAVRDALGADVPVMADANSAYSIADAEHLARVDTLGLTMLEQPLGYDDLVQHAALQRRLQTPLCLDESISTVERARDMVTLESARIVNIKPGRVGGLTESIAIHDLCEDAGIPVWCGGMLESGIGRAYNVALASLRNFELPGDLSPSARYWERDIVTPEWSMSGDGMVRVPVDSPGIGVAPDLDRIDALTTRRTTLVADVR